MAATWYCRVDGDELGPLSPAALKQLVDQGRIAADSLIRRGEDGPWVAASKVKGLLAGGGDSALAHDSAQLVGAASSSSKGSKEAVKPSQKLPQAKTGKAKSAATAPAAARPAAPKPAVRNSDSSVIPGSASTASAKPGGSELLSGRRRKQSILPLIITLVVVALLVVGAGIFAIVSYALHSAQEAVAHFDDVLENIPNNNSSATDGASGGTNPLPEAGIGGPTGGESPDDYRRRVVRSIDQWRPALNRVGGTKKMKVRVDAVWLGSDAGRDVSPQFVPADSAARFVFVRVVVNNAAADEELDYAGWNTSDVQDQAILVDDHDAFCPLVSLEDSRNERLPRTRIAAKQSVTDVLVFHAPRHAFEHLRLAVPFDNGNHYGLQIDRAMLAKTGPIEEPRDLP